MIWLFLLLLVPVVVLEVGALVAYWLEYRDSKNPKPLDWQETFRREHESGIRPVGWHDPEWEVEPCQICATSQHCLDLPIERRDEHTPRGLVTVDHRKAGVSPRDAEELRQEIYGAVMRAGGVWSVDQRKVDSEEIARRVFEAGMRGSRRDRTASAHTVRWLKCRNCGPTEFIERTSLAGRRNNQCLGCGKTTER